MCPTVTHDVMTSWLRSKKTAAQQTRIDIFHYVTTGASIYISFLMSLLLNNFWTVSEIFRYPKGDKNVASCQVLSSVCSHIRGKGGGLAWVLWSQLLQGNKVDGMWPMCQTPSKPCAWAQVSKDKCGQIPRRGWVQSTLYCRGCLALIHCRMSAV